MELVREVWKLKGEHYKWTEWICDICKKEYLSKHLLNFITKKFQVCNDCWFVERNFIKTKKKWPSFRARKKTIFYVKEIKTISIDKSTSPSKLREKNEKNVLSTT